MVFTYVDLSAVRERRVVWNDTRQTRFADSSSRARRVVRTGDAIFGTVRPANQSHASFQSLNDRVVVSTGFTVLRPDPAKLNHRYLHYLLFSRDVLRQSVRAAVGSNYPAVTDQDVAELKVNLPSLSNQLRIVETLDSLTDSESSIEASIAKLRITRQARIDAAATCEADGGCLGERLLRMDAGRSPDLPNAPAAPGAWGVLKVSAVHTDGFRPMENKAVTDPSHVNERYRVHSGDLLISRANTPELVGSACIASQTAQHLMLSDKTLRIVENPALADREFINLCLASEHVRQQISTLSSGSSRSMQNISQKAISALILPWPPLAAQRKTVAEVAALDTLIAAERANLAKLRSLKAGLVDDLLAGKVGFRNCA
ncbi:restriction endonuclease subunit S [Streptomyces sp. NA02950]|uniref:restriction endonuclease subunit S n=1 Tax=Streptomyces sp. NA02950 TaxID=2742137 RepID=UPI0020CA9E69|nr:restriction endonuclease subunit S [Streptomyces sp. NA02950]